MQKFARVAVLCLVCLVVTTTSGPVVAAVDSIPTPNAEFGMTPPLMITAYQTAGAATTLLAVEVYNDGDAPLNLDLWKLGVLTKMSTSAYDIETSTTHHGMLLPGEHVTIVAAGATTYTLTSLKQASQITSIVFRYTGSDVVYKDSTAAIKDMLDFPLFRSYISTGYSTASQPFVATPSRSFYDDGLYQAQVAPDGLKIIEIYPYSSDCSPFDESILCGDYVKLYNASDESISLDDLVLRTDSSSSSRISSNTFTFSGELTPQEVRTISMTDTGGRISLTNSGGYVWLEDAWNMARYDTTLVRYVSASTSQQGYAYALATDGTWQWTTSPQPSRDNLITAPVAAVADCPEGKYRNPDTGRCRTLEETVNALATCDEGYERNLETNRCRKIALLATATLPPCVEGYERNPATNRCRSIASAVAELMPCDEGYERNPETNRCRKIQTAAMPLAAFPVQPVTDLKSDPAGMIALAAVATTAVGYIVWEWRREIARVLRGAVGFLARTK